MNRQFIRESNIPIQILYNETINKIKKQEKEEYLEPKPLTFSIKKEADSNE